MIYAEKWSKRRKKSSIACARQTDPSRWKTFDQEKKCRSVVADDSSSFKLIQILSVRLIKKKILFLYYYYHHHHHHSYRVLFLFDIHTEFNRSCWSFWSASVEIFSGGERKCWNTLMRDARVV
jgi:hypothetical protein